MNNSEKQRRAEYIDTLHTTPELPEDLLEEIRQRHFSTGHLTGDLLSLETNTDGGIDLVLLHHNEGRLVLATIPEWAHLLAERIKHMDKDVEQLLKEVKRLQASAGLNGQSAYAARLRELRELEIKNQRRSS